MNQYGMQQYQQPSLEQQMQATYQNRLAQLQQMYPQMVQQPMQQYQHQQQPQYPPISCPIVSCIEEVMASAVDPSGAPRWFYAAGMDAFLYKKMDGRQPKYGIYQFSELDPAKNMQNMQPETIQQPNNDMSAVMEQMQAMQAEIERLKGANANEPMEPTTSTRKSKSDAS